MSLVPGNPLKMTSVVAAWQGLAKSERVTEWPEAKVNSIVSPTAAVMVSGVKTRPFLPTATWWTFGTEAEDAAVALVVAVVVVVVAEDGLPYWPYTALGSRVARRTVEIDEDIMMPVDCASLVDEKAGNLLEVLEMLCRV
jgi:hypothetical protein